MSLNLEIFTLGPLDNNTFVVVDEASSTAIIIDPAQGSLKVIDWCIEQNLVISQILLTHGHFDHFWGLEELGNSLIELPPIRLHHADFQIYNSGGGVNWFGQATQVSTYPAVDFGTKKHIHLGEDLLHVFHTPGHSPGHVIFHVPCLAAAFVGDLIFQGSVGRTDLPGGDSRQLMASIQQSVLTFPKDTKLYPGHGPATTVADELKYNPYLQ